MDDKRYDTDRVQDSEEFTKGGNSIRDKATGNIHHTSYGNDSHISWDENDKGDVSRMHSTNHDTKEITNHSTDKHGNPTK